MKAAPAVLYAVLPHQEAAPLAHCGLTEEAPTLPLSGEIWTSLNQGCAAETFEGTLMPLADSGGLCGILALGQGQPTPEAQGVWQLCRDFLCSRLRLALEPTEVHKLPNQMTLKGGGENGLSVTKGLVLCDSLADLLKRGGQPTVPELLRNQTLAALRELLGPRDTVGILPSGDAWFLVVTTTPPDLDLLAFTVAESLAEKLSTDRVTLSSVIRLTPQWDPANEFLDP